METPRLSRRLPRVRIALNEFEDMEEGMEWSIGVPQFIWLAFTSLGLIIVAVEHGKPKRGKWNFCVSLVVALISFGILLWGDFFTD